MECKMSLNASNTLKGIRIKTFNIILPTSYHLLLCLFSANRQFIVVTVAWQQMWHMLSGMANKCGHAAACFCSVWNCCCPINLCKCVCYVLTHEQFSFQLLWMNVTFNTNLIIVDSYPLRTLQVSSQAEQQLMRNGVHQVEKSRILVQNVIEWCSLQAQVLRHKKEKVQ